MEILQLGINNINGNIGIVQTFSILLSVAG